MRVETLQTRNECRSNPSLALVISNRVAEMVSIVSNILKRGAVLLRRLGDWWKEQNLRAAEIEHLKYQDRLKRQAGDPYRGFGRFYY
jgi:hypothetical protein